MYGKVVPPKKPKPNQENEIVKGVVGTAWWVTSTLGLTKSADPNPPQRALYDKVLWCNFDKLEIGKDICIQCLVICYKNGFQIWDISTSEFREIYNRKEKNPTLLLKLLPNPSPESDDIFKEVRPLALIYSEEMSDQYGLIHPTRIYSCSKNEYISRGKSNYLLPNTTLYNISATSEYIFLAAYDSILIINAHNFAQHKKIDKMASIPKNMNIYSNQNPNNAAPNPNGETGMWGGIHAVHSRWIAYPSTVTLPPEEEKRYQESETVYFLSKAKEFGSQIMDLGGKLYSWGAQMVVSDPNAPSPSSQPPSPQPSISNLEAEIGGGVITIEDLKEKCQLTSFRAYKLPIGCISWDPSGTLLAVASIEGLDINIYQISVLSPDLSLTDKISNSLELKSTLIYKLFRGVSPAGIRSIQFSLDSKFVAATSINVTTHIWAINIHGGAVTSKTHRLPPSSNSPTASSSTSSLSFTGAMDYSQSLYTHSNPNFFHSHSEKLNEPKVYQYEVIGRCHKHSVEDESSPFRGICKFNTTSSFLSIQSAGIALQYIIKRKIDDVDHQQQQHQHQQYNHQSPSGNSNLNNLKLNVEIENDKYWDVCRRSDQHSNNAEIACDLQLLEKEKRTLASQSLRFVNDNQYLNQSEHIMGSTFDESSWPYLYSDQVFHCITKDNSGDEGDAVWKSIRIAPNTKLPTTGKNQSYHSGNGGGNGSNQLYSPSSSFQSTEEVNDQNEHKKREIERSSSNGGFSDFLMTSISFTPSPNNNVPPSSNLIVADEDYSPSVNNNNRINIVENHQHNSNNNAASAQPIPPSDFNLLKFSTQNNNPHSNINNNKKNNFNIEMHINNDDHHHHHDNVNHHHHQYPYESDNYPPVPDVNENDGYSPHVPYSSPPDFFPPLPKPKNAPSSYDFDTFDDEDEIDFGYGI